jgi:hypothetical protein
LERDYVATGQICIGQTIVPFFGCTIPLPLRPLRYLPQNPW